MHAFFHPEADINWHNTNEHFTEDEFIRVNSEYSDSFRGNVEWVEVIGDLFIAVMHVYGEHAPISAHATAFIKVRDSKIEP